MVIRFKVAFDNGKVCCAVGETTGDLPAAYAERLVRVGLAEAVPGDTGVNMLRAEMGLAPIPSMSMTRLDLLAMAANEGVTIETDDNKADLIAKINAHRHG